MPKDIKKVIKIDTSEAEKSLDGLTGKIKDLKKELNDTGKFTVEYSEKVKKHKEAVKESEEEEKKQAQTVKELRNEINALRDSLVPMTKGSEEWNKTTTDLVEKQKKLTDVMQASKEQMTAAAGSYNALQNEMTALRREWKETTDEATRADLARRIAEINTQLKELDSTIGNNQRRVGSYEDALRGVLSEYTSQRAELKALRVELEGLEPGTEAYNTAFMRAAEITHNLAEQQEMLKYSSTDLGDQLSNIRGIASNVAAGFSAVNAAFGLFGGESEDVQKAMLKVQRAIALVQGLQGIDGFIKRTKGLSNALKTWTSNSKKVTVQQTTQATATKAAATATVAETTATEAATVAQKGLNAAMAANPVGIIIAALAVLLPILDKAFGIFEKTGKAIGKLVNKEKAAAKETKKIAEDYIADKEAQLGSDWKYTEEGQKYYQQYFDSLLKMYKKDSKDYKEAQRDKWEYERELLEHQQKAAEDAKKKEEERRKDAAAAAKTAAEKLKQIETDYQSKVASQVSTNWKQTYQEFRENAQALFKYFEEEANKQKDKGLVKWIKTASENYNKTLNNELNDTKVLIAEINALLNGASVEEIGNAIKNTEIRTMEQIMDMSYDDLMDKLSKIGEEGGFTLAEGMKIKFDIELQRLEKVAIATLNDIIANSSDEASKKINDEVIKLFEKTIEPKLNDEIQKLQAELSSKTIQLDFEIETGMALWPFSEGDYLYVDQMASEFEKAQEIYDKNVEMLNKQKAYYQEVVDFVKKNNILPSDEYKNAEAQIENIDTALLQAKSNYYLQQVQIRKKYFDKELSEEKSQTEALLRATENRYNQELSINDLFQGVWPEREQALADEIYQIRQNSLQRQMEMYEKQLYEQNLTADERIETEKMVASIMSQIEEGEIQHTMETNQRRIEAFQMWYSMAQDTVGGIADLIGGLSDYYEADVEAKVKAGEMSEEQADSEFENIKKMRIAEATINTLAGSIGAFLQATATYPPPAGQIIGAISAAAVAAAGAAQIAKIKQSTRNGSSSSNSAIATPQMQPYEPQYVTNTTGASDVENLRNALYEQPIRAFVVESDISGAQERSRRRNEESSF